MAKTLFEKVWRSHTVATVGGDRTLLYIDRHYIHEVTSPVAFSGLKKRGLKVYRPSQITAMPDHNIPTVNQHLPASDPQSRSQLETLAINCDENGINIFNIGTPHHGIVHVAGPESGLTLPGSTIVCGDSHTSTHGAFGAIAFGIGTSEVEMVLASQCILQQKPKTMRINVDGDLNKGVTPKDIILYIISRISASGGTGYFIEFSGPIIRNMSMEGRMTVCNMSIECGARGGIIAPDKITMRYLRDREFTPNNELWRKRSNYWKSLETEEGSIFDSEYGFHAEDIPVMITYGTNPGMGMSITGEIPSANKVKGVDAVSYQKALDYMGFKEGEKLEDKPIDYVFVGSCTNGRIEDFRLFAELVKGRKKADGITVWLVPGSKEVERLCEEEGITQTLLDAGFELRQPGCSACLAMNDDKIPEGKYCISTSNRNFEGRQGPGARTLLSGIPVAAAAAITGRITDPAKFFNM